METGLRMTGIEEEQGLNKEKAVLGWGWKWG